MLVPNSHLYTLPLPLKNRPDKCNAFHVLRFSFDRSRFPRFHVSGFPRFHVPVFHSSNIQNSLFTIRYSLFTQRQAANSNRPSLQAPKPLFYPNQYLRNPPLAWLSYCLVCFQIPYGGSKTISLKNKFFTSSGLRLRPGINFAESNIRC